MQNQSASGDRPAPATKCVDVKLTEALRRIAAACTPDLKKKLLAGKVTIPEKRLMAISRMAPPMRAAQARSYKETGTSLQFPRYLDVLDAAMAQSEPADGEPEVIALARPLNNAEHLTTAGGDIDAPPLDTEHVSELMSRLSRALGLVAKVVVDLPRLHDVRPSGEEVAALLERVGKLATYSQTIAELLRLPLVRRAEALRPLRGTYVVVCYLPEDTHFPDVGTFGALTLPKGWYSYVGSAFGSGGVKARVRTHARRARTSFVWNSHYVRPAMRIEDVWASYDREKRECQWAKLIYEQLGGAVLFPTFGAGDCKKLPPGRRCKAHFYHFTERPTDDAFARAAFEAMPCHAHVEAVDGTAVEPGSEAHGPRNEQ